METTPTPAAGDTSSVADRAAMVAVLVPLVAWGMTSRVTPVGPGRVRE